MYEQLSEGESDEWHNSHSQTRRTAEKPKDGETCRRRQHQYEKVQDSISLLLKNKCAITSKYSYTQRRAFKLPLVNSPTYNNSPLRYFYARVPLFAPQGRRSFASLLQSDLVSSRRILRCERFAQGLRIRLSRREASRSDPRSVRASHAIARYGRHALPRRTRPVAVGGASAPLSIPPSTPRGLPAS